jgi:serine/threonine protein phosphatase 1
MTPSRFGRLGSIARRRTSATHERQTPCTPDGRRLYAIGDIHGRYDLLLELQERIRHDAQAHPDRRQVIVYLGDYIDRGPESREVLEHLIEHPLEGMESIHLMGNHEQGLLGFLRDPDACTAWLMYGGLATLASYGIGRWTDGFEKPPSRLAHELQRAMPETHRRFLERLERYRCLGDYLFVHAGIRPNVPIEEQTLADLLWIRDDFLRFDRPHPYVVVHGHQVTNRPESRPNRIGIDTGAFATGRLTCLILDGTERIFIDTAP